LTRFGLAFSLALQRVPDRRPHRFGRAVRRADCDPVGDALDPGQVPHRMGFSP
jgi:hypothetical protein